MALFSVVYDACENYVSGREDYMITNEETKKVMRDLYADLKKEE